MKRILQFILILINLIVFVGLVFSTCTSFLNSHIHPTLVIATMTFPVWALLAATLLIFNFFFWRPGCVLIGAGLSFGLFLILSVFPVNFSRGTVPEKIESKSWTLLSYNVCTFYNMAGGYPDDTNPTVSYILKTDADVVVLAEGQYLLPIKEFYISQSQIDSINARYPYRVLGGDVALLSKFPAKPIATGYFPRIKFDRNPAATKVGFFEIDINGEKTVIAGCHLQSLGLTRSDKNLYKELTKGEGLTSRTELKEVKNDLFSKIGAANASRASEADAIVSVLDSLDCKNVIVCGDFNDTPGCYALRTLRKIGLREVYPLVATGYKYTFNKDRLLFRIDHVLFKGDFRPWSIERPIVPYSDHYPLITTFVPDSHSPH